MKQILSLATLFVLYAVQAQISPVERHWINNGGVHSAVKNIAFYQLDSLLNDTASNVKFSIAPDVLGAYQLEKFKIRTGVGLLVKANYKNKLSMMANYRFGYGNQSSVSYQSLLQSKSYFTSPLKNGDYIYHDLRGRVLYNPNKYFEFQAGLDHLFIGEGDRSLFIGNQGIPNPFASLKASLWKFEYHFIQQVWREPKRTNVFSPKGNSSHYLSFKANKNWSFGFFESVVYDMKDTLYNRGFELEYLNPLIFFRPQEYSLGSSDNIVIGLQTSFQWKQHMLYGQLVLDEFFLAEIKARNRWWANKFGFQLGYKTFIDRGENHWFVRSEINMVRPFTYSQLNQNIVYGNQQMPVAHPLGSNFLEFYQEVALTRGKWEFTAWGQIYLKGKDTLNNYYSFGGDIYKPYTHRPADYNFKIGSGMTYHAYHLGFQIARSVMGDHIQAFAEPRIWVGNLEGKVSTDFYFTVGIHRKIGADRRNY